MAGFARRLACALLVAAAGLWPLLANAQIAAPTTQMQSATTVSLPGFPDAVVFDRSELPIQSRQFVLGPVERKRREVRIAASRSMQAGGRTTTYEVPRGVALDSVVEHYRQLLSGHLVYECGGRDCGRSNDWANTVFARADLYGPDGNQRYLAADFGSELIAIYVIRRGNQRLYAHVVAYQPQTPLNLQPVAAALGDAAAALALHGRFLINEVRPASDGSLSAADIARLQLLGAQLREQALPPIYAVCHLHPAARPPQPSERTPRSAALRDTSDATALRLEASGRCAEAAAKALAGDAMIVIPFGVGPLAPTTARPFSHLELILPPAG